MSVAVEFREVVKSFGPVRVLHGVSLALEPGRVYGLLGENGAGKSTLMKILAGYEPLSGGEVRINGRAVHFSGSREAEAEGIVLIHQEFNLAEDLSVAQNIFLGHEKKRGWLLDDDSDAQRGRCRAGAGRAEGRSRHQGARSDRRREAARRDRQGAGAQGPPADHGRADGNANARRD